jgi:predicted dehydrogenase/nucleoside-diphosphate-sugar epimerase
MTMNNLEHSNVSNDAPPRLRIAVVGCGAVTENFHLPVLAGHDGVTISALVEPNTARGEKLAKLYNVPTVLASADRLDRSVADAALLATPAFLHAAGSIDLMRKGMHVLVEKPMALGLSDAAQMVAAAKDNGVVLTVGLFRRLLPAIRLFRAAVDAGHVGDPLRVVAEVGDAYTWSLTTLAGMRRQEAGGGMLIDMGSHVLDLLLYMFNAAPRLVEYADNAGEGVETDCALQMTLHRRNAAIPARVELSRTRSLSNSIVLEGSRGRLEWKFGERAKLLVHSNDVFVDPLSSLARPCTIEAAWGDEPEQPGYEGFRAQIDDLLRAIRTHSDGELSGESVLPTVDVIEQCYARRRPLDEPWVTAQLPTASARPRSAAGKRVLVTGASGFIGCRLSERLHFGSDWTVRALIRTPGRAVRLARMPIEFAIGDLSSPTDLARALEGCDAVVHAGIGTSWRESERFAVNVKGTRNLVDAALRADVKRFIHISTLALYGERVTGTITEDTPLQPKKGWDYAESKHAAEQIVLEAAGRGLPAIVLRPSVVYGPHNMTIVTRPLMHLMQNRLELVNCREVPSNTIYVDNLCFGIQQALDVTADLAGQIFLLNDDDGYTWGDYFGYFADRMGARIQYVSKSGAAGDAIAPPAGVLKRWVSSTRDLLLSSEAKGLAKRIYLSDPWGTPARWAVDTFPAGVARLKERLRPDEGFVYRPNPAGPELPLFTVDPIAARVSTEKAQRMLGFAALVPRQRAMELTLQWARYARVVPQSAADEVGTIVGR